MGKLKDLYKRKYYVYEHVIDGNVFYVGKGTGARAVDFLGRTPKWKELTNGRFSEIDVNILAYFDNNSDAKLYQARHIKNVVSKGHKLINVKHNNKNKIYRHKRKEYVTKDNESKAIVDYSIFLDLKILNEYINKYLTTEDKEKLCEDLDIRDKNNRLKKWASTKKLLISSGYEIKDSKITIDGKRVNVSTITIKR